MKALSDEQYRVLEAAAIEGRGILCVCGERYSAHTCKDNAIDIDSMATDLLSATDRVYPELRENSNKRKLIAQIEKQYNAKWPDYAGMRSIERSWKHYFLCKVCKGADHETRFAKLANIFVCRGCAQEIDESTWLLFPRSVLSTVAIGGHLVY